MSFTKNTTPFLAAALLVAGGLACSKPAAAPQPVQPVKAAPAPKADDAARKTADADAKRKAEDAEAARKAAAMAAYEHAAATALKDVHFAFDSSEIRSEDKPTLMAIADFIKAYPQAHLTVEGNCDERGTVEYNLALGERRAHAAMAFLVGLGAPDARLSMTSFGKEKPVCTESTESCWGQNRRAHFSLK
jgi:peptidoglycan-associated lipoprotein